MENRTVKVAQISDSHLLHDSKLTIHDANPYERLSHVINYIKKNRYEMILFTGDIANDGSQESYRQLSDLIMGIKDKIFVIPGNHDDMKNIVHVLPQSNLFVSTSNNLIRISNWYFLYLATVVEDEDYGRISSQTMKEFESALQNLHGCNICVVMHHHPFNVGLDFVDKYKIENFGLISGLFSRVKLVMYGHVHNDYTLYRDGAVYSSCPSTCFQFVKNRKINNRLYGFKEYILNDQDIFFNSVWFDNNEIVGRRLE